MIWIQKLTKISKTKFVQKVLGENHLDSGKISVYLESAFDLG